MKSNILTLLFVLKVITGLCQTNNNTIQTPTHPPAPPIVPISIDERVKMEHNSNKDLQKSISNLSLNIFEAIPQGQNPAQSAETASNLRFRDIGVNSFTGSMYLPIPIYTLNEGPLNIPISLNYNGAGIKNQELSSSLGLGWSLTAGGSISRFVRGMPDEGLSDATTNYRGYYKHGFSDVGFTYEQDTEPDIFYMNINGESYKFVYRWNGANAKFEFLPLSDIKIEVDFSYLPNNLTVGVFNSFTASMPDGTKYFFSDKESSAEFETISLQNGTNYPGTTGFYNLWEKSAQISAWYLTKITSVYGQEIKFEYDNEQYSFYRLNDHGVDGSNGLEPVYSQVQNDLKINRVFVKSQSLSKISGINTKVEFNKRTKTCTYTLDESTGLFDTLCFILNNGTPRTDIDSWARYPQSQSYSKRIDEILIMDNTIIPKDTLIYKFNYGFFTGIEDDLPSPYTTAIVGFSHQKRLKLDKITFPDKTNIRFRYKGDDPTFNGKSRLNYGIDHWGYANGSTGNRSLTGLIPVDEYYPNSTNASNRLTDPNFSFYGSLDSVVFENRKIIAFFYDLHQADNYRNGSNITIPIGGSRIKEIKTKDLISGIETIKTYDFSQTDGKTSGFLLMKPCYRYRFRAQGSFSGLYNLMTSYLNRPLISYNRVIERIKNSSGNFLGKSITYFDQDFDEILPGFKTSITTYPAGLPPQTKDTIYLTPIYQHGKVSNYDYSVGYFWYNIGNIIKTETYNEAGDTLTINKFLYHEIMHTTTSHASVVRKFNGLTFGSSLISNPSNPSQLIYGYRNKYYHYYKKYGLTSYTTKTFSQNGQNPIVSKVDFTFKENMPYSFLQNYPGSHNQVSQTETTDSKGNISKQIFTYTGDFDFPGLTVYTPFMCDDGLGGTYDCGYSTFTPYIPKAGSQARGIYELKKANIVGFPVETQTQLNYLNTGATYNAIYSFPKPSGGFNYAPLKSYTTGNIGNTHLGITYDKALNDTIFKSQSYYLNSTVLNLNDFGLPTSVKPFGGPVSNIIFDSSKLLPITQVSNSNGIVIDSTTMFYDHKLYGVNKIIGSNKLQNIVLFDTTFKKGSVLQKLDKDKNILSAINYFEPYEPFNLNGLSLDISKFRTISRMPRVASTSIPLYGDSLNVDVSYSDAEGRNLLSKSLRASPTKKDMIGSTSIYDSYGRPFQNILPVNASSSDGSFETNILVKAQTAYSDTYPFSAITLYEASPLSRTFKTIGPGAAFRPNKESVQSFETGNFGIKNHVVDFISYLNISNFIGNQITKSTSTDENGNKTINYTDKEGRTLESWVQFKGDGSIADHYLKTTYLYDYLNRPIGTILPNLYGLIPSGTNLALDIYYNSIYLDSYDIRGRMVTKTVPDKGITYIVYNRLGQVVLTQNARDRLSNMWLWNKYGSRGQAVLSGTLIQSTYTREQIQQKFDDFTEDKQFEEFTGSAGTDEGYTKRSFPSDIQAFISNADIKSVSFFDTYSWLNASQASSLAFKKYSTNKWPHSKGLMTGAKVRRLDNNSWLASAMYYDDKNRLIQTQSENRYGLINQTDIVQDFIGQVLENHATYRKPNKPTLNISTSYTYDHAGRKVSASHYLNGKPELLSSYNYDELGRLIRKNINEPADNFIIRQTPVKNKGVSMDVAKDFILLSSGTEVIIDSVYDAFTASTSLQKVNYAYDVRGNMRCINCTPNGRLDSSKVFSMKLDYFQDGRFYNGLLSKQAWKSSADTNTRRFTYDYDKAYRLSKGDFGGPASENYSVSKIRYDFNGNIDTLQRYGKTGVGTFGLIDNLKYYYGVYANQLTTIDDAASQTLGFKNVPGANDFTHNSNGDLKTDLNKGITNIEYNYMGLIDKVHFGPNKRIENTYTADGQKLSTKYIDGASTLTKDYIGELIYINDTLRSIWHDEGRIVFNNAGQPTYQYFINDHQGSTRVVFQKLNANTFIAQRIDYGVGGDVISENTGPNLLTHLYQGKEWQDGFGYDFMTRTYDPYTMRMLQVDGAKQFASGYTGMGNNPVSGIDPDGQFVIPATIGFFKGLLTGRSNFETKRDGSQASTRFGNAFRSSARHVSNWAKINAGLFASDKNKPWYDRIGEVYSRFTWQLPQTIAGLTYSQTANLIKRVDGVEYYGGATFVKGGGWGAGSVSLGSFISLGKDGEEKVGTIGPGGYTFMHEYGHYLQSQEMGPLYLLKVGIPSAGGANWTELDANFRAANYFQKRDTRFTWSQTYTGDIYSQFPANLQITSAKLWEYPLAVFNPFIIPIINFKRPR